MRLTGFGNAAGLLAMRNLFGMGKHLDGDTATQMRQAEQPAGVPTSASTSTTTTTATAPSTTAAKKVIYPLRVTPTGGKYFYKIFLGRGFFLFWTDCLFQKFPDLRSATEGETPEEQEERTLENLEKMMEAGLIKVIKKDDKDKEKDKEKN